MKEEFKGEEIVREGVLFKSSENACIKVLPIRNAMQNQIVKRIMHWKDILEYYFTHFSGNTYPFIMYFVFLFCLLKLTHRLPSKLILFYLHIYIITYMYVLSVYIWQYCYSSFHSLEHSNDVMYVCIEPMETKSDKDWIVFYFLIEYYGTCT